MKFSQIKQTETGVSFKVDTTTQEAEYLINFAVERLLQEGILSLNSGEEEQEVELKGRACH